MTMSRQESGEKIPSLEQLSTLDLIKILSSRLEQGDARQHMLHLTHLEGLIKTAKVQAERRDRNARVAINRLPAEVLREIFVTNCTVKLAEYGSTRYRFGNIMTAWNPTWIERGRAVHLMLVCCHWKEIALEIRELWNSIETYSHDKYQILLERSGRGPLRVLACGKLEPSSAVAHALQDVEHSSRIEEIYWRWSSVSQNRDHREYLRMPAPSLRSLALSGEWSGMPHGSFTLFDNHTPSLEHLSLSRHCWLPSNGFAKLTFLVLHRCHVPKAPIKLRSLLAGTPNLVDLILQDVEDHKQQDAVTGPADMKPVSLARLRRLLIEDMWADDIDYVFRDARLNEDLSVSVNFETKGTHVDDEQQVLEVVSGWSLNALKQPKELHFQQHVVIVPGASSGLRCGDVKGSGMIRTLAHWIKFKWPQILPLSSISHLCMFEWDTGGVPSLEHVRDLLRQTIALETLSINIEVLTKIVDALTLLRDPIDRPLCPTLTTLRITIRKDSDCDIILDSILPRRAQLAIKHLYVGLIDPQSERWRPRQAVKDQLHDNFESVNFETLLYDNAYGITLPPVCDEEAHALWPPWL